MYSRVSLQRLCWPVLSCVMESKAAPTQSSCPSGTDRFFLRHSWHFVPGYSHASLRDNKSPAMTIKLALMLHHPGKLFGCGMQSVNDPPNRICRAFSACVLSTNLSWASQAQPRLSSVSASPLFESFLA